MIYEQKRSRMCAISNIIRSTRQPSSRRQCYWNQFVGMWSLWNNDLFFDYTFMKLTLKDARCWSKLETCWTQTQIIQCLVFYVHVKSKCRNNNFHHKLKSIYCTNYIFDDWISSCWFFYTKNGVWKFVRILSTFSNYNNSGDSFVLKMLCVALVTLWNEAK